MNSISWEEYLANIISSMEPLLQGVGLSHAEFKHMALQEKHPFHKELKIAWRRGVSIEVAVEDFKKSIFQFIIEPQLRGAGNA